MQEVEGRIYDVDKAREGQEKYCEKADVPHFAPKTGTCWRCGMNIYEPHGWKYENRQKIKVALDQSPEYITGIDVNEASNGLVTGCPHCNRSYCD